MRKLRLSREQNSLRIQRLTYSEDLRGLFEFVERLPFCRTKAEQLDLLDIILLRWKSLKERCLYGEEI